MGLSVGAPRGAGGRLGVVRRSVVADGPLEADALRALKEALRVELCVLALYLLDQWLRGAHDIVMRNASRARAVVVVAAESEVSDLLYMRICVESITPATASFNHWPVDDCSRVC